MLVIVTDNQILATDVVCHSCLFANQQGQPRWSQGQLQCGRLLGSQDNNKLSQYECCMGFKIAEVG